MRIDTGDLGLYSRPKEFVESAQNLTPEKSKDRRKAWHVMVIRASGDHTRSCLTLAFEREHSCSAPLTLAYFGRVCIIYDWRNLRQALPSMR